MTNKDVTKKIKRNKYRLVIGIIAIIAILILIFSIRNYFKERAVSKYDNEILIVKGDGDQLDSKTLKEIRNSGSDKKTVYLNNGMEKVDIQGIPVEKIIGNLNINLKDRSYLVVEDNNGNSKKIPMSATLEPERIYLVYKINDSPLYDLNPSYGKLAIIDTTLDDSSSWIKNVKTIDIQ